MPAAAPIAIGLSIAAAGYTIAAGEEARRKASRDRAEADRRAAEEERKARDAATRKIQAERQADRRRTGRESTLLAAPVGLAATTPATALGT